MNIIQEFFTIIIEILLMLPVVLSIILFWIFLWGTIIAMFSAGIFFLIKGFIWMGAI